LQPKYSFWMCRYFLEATFKKITCSRCNFYHFYLGLLGLNLGRNIAYAMYGFTRISSVIACKCRDSNLSQATAASIHIPSNFLFTMMEL
jgi:hypothetical protein